eukprot:6270497-Amphidinium_carterae.1
MSIGRTIPMLELTLKWVTLGRPVSRHHQMLKLWYWGVRLTKKSRRMKGTIGRPAVSPITLFIHPRNECHDG